MAEKGLGTPATRAGHHRRPDPKIHAARRPRAGPTAKAFQLDDPLRGLTWSLTQPELTGNWEYQLAEMEHGCLKREAFMAEIA